MSRAGRKRRFADRGSTGRIIQPLTDRGKLLSTAVRLRQQAEEGAADARWATPVGQMFYKRDASENQFVAAGIYAAMRHAVDVIHGFSSRHIKAMDVNAAKGMVHADDDPEKEIKDRDTIRRFYEAEGFVGVGSPELAAIQFVVLYDQAPIGPAHKEALKRGLDLLARFFGVEKR